MAAGLVSITVAGVGIVQFMSSDGTPAGVLTPIQRSDDLAALIGDVAASPAANTVLDRLKTIATNLTSLAGFLDGVEGLQGSTNTLLTTIGGYLDGLETLQGTTNTSLTAIAGYVDGLEALTTTLNGYVDGLEAKDDALKASVDALLAAIRPPQNHFVIVPGTGALANPTRRIVAGAAGTLTVEANGVAASYAVSAGQIFDIVAQKITAAPANSIGQY